MQHHVLAGSGVTVASCYLMHLNRAHVYNDHDYDPINSLLRNFTSDVRKLDIEIPNLITAQREALAQIAPPDDRTRSSMLPTN